MKKRNCILILFFIFIFLFESSSFASFNIDTSNLKKATDNTNTSNSTNNTTTTEKADESIDSLKEKQTTVKQDIEEQTQNLEDVQELVTDQLTLIQELDEKIQTQEEEINQTNMKIYRYEAKIKEAQEYIDNYQSQYDEKQETLDQRLVNLYMHGQYSYLDILLSSVNPVDFLNKYYYIKELSKSDLELMEEIANDQEILEQYKAELEQDQIELGELKKSYTVTEKILENIKVLRQKYVNELSAQEREYQAKIDEYNQELSQINSQILQLAKDSIDTDYIGGIFAWPTPGYTTITSEYGMRTHPITGVYKLHTGVDIGAPYGANFIAVNDGVVTKACYNSAYGNMVIIDHGGGISTLYAHGSEILVSEGDYVTCGTPVLKVGSTGYSTRAHAHFEVRLDGVVTNPMPYITGGVVPTVDT